MLRCSEQSQIGLVSPDLIFAGGMSRGVQSGDRLKFTLFAAFPFSGKNKLYSCLLFLA
jgi:hypothetical protein